MCTVRTALWDPQMLPTTVDHHNLEKHSSLCILPVFPSHRSEKRFQFPPGIVRQQQALAWDTKVGEIEDKATR